MSKIIAVPWNAHKYSTIPACIYPTSTNGVIDSSIYKFGGGSVKSLNNTTDIYEEWTNLDEESVTLGDDGCIGFWAYWDEVGYKRMRVRAAINYPSGYPSMIWFYFQLNTIGSSIVQLRMEDSDSAVVLYPDDTLSLSVEGWHYAELNWKWNDASGITELSWDGTVILSETDGNTRTRGTVQPVQQMLAESEYMSGYATTRYIDDFVVYDTRQHVGNFSVPASAQAPDLTCPIESTIVNTFGFPFGMRGFTR